MSTPPVFKWRHFQADIILLNVRWYCRYGLSYRDLEEMMAERGIEVDHSTINRACVEVRPELDKRIRPHLQSTNDSWRVDETYIKVKGQWKYLYRAVDSEGKSALHARVFYLTKKRNASAQLQHGRWARSAGKRVLRCKRVEFKPDAMIQPLICE